MVGGVLRKLFAIYPGEEKRALCFVLLGYMWALAVTSAIKFSDALFITYVGAQALPTVYILTSSIVIVTALFFLNVFHKVKIHNLYLGTVSVGICFYFIALFCMWNPKFCFSNSIIYSLRVFGYAFLAVMLTCFWTFVDHFYNLQDSKRHYSLFTSAMFGGIATAGAILHTELVNFETWLFCVVGLLALSLGLIRYITKRFQAVHNELDHENSSQQEDYSFFALTQAIFSSKFTQLLVTGAFLIYLILSFTEYNYMASFQKHFFLSQIQNTEYQAYPELKRFLGKCLLGVSLINIFIGLFVYSRVIRRFGVTSLLTFTPFVLFITYFGWNFSDALIFPILGFFVDEGSIYVIEDSNLNLMLNGVPTKVKYKIRILIESFFEPFGMFVSGVILSLPMVNTKQLGLFFAILALGTAILLRRNYLKAIYRNLMENAIHFERPVNKWFASLNGTAEKKFLKILTLPEKTSQSFALEGLIHFDNPDKLLKTLDQCGVFAKLRFLELLPKSSFFQNTKVLDTLHKWELETDNLHLQTAIQLYLAKLGLLHPEKAVLHLQSAHHDLKAAALISLKKSWANLPPQAATHYRALANQEIRRLLESKRKGEICLGLEALGIDATAHDVSVLFQFLNHPFLAIARSAAQSIAEVADPTLTRYGETLMERLKTGNDHSLRIACLEALGKLKDPTLARGLIFVSHHFRPKERRVAEDILYNMGLVTVPTLVAITKDTSSPDLCRLLAGRVLGRLSPPQLHSILYDVMRVEITRAKFYNDHHLTIQARYPSIDLSLLVASLKSSYYSLLDFIIQILGVAGELEDCEQLSRLIRSNHPKIRSQVVEALEKTCDIAIFRLLAPLLNQNIAPIDHIGCNLEELLDRLAQSPLPLDQVIAATFKHRLNAPNWKKTLRLQMLENEEIFHNFALELLET